MGNIRKFFLLITALIVTAASVCAQTTKWRDAYKVKKKDTLYGIAKKYGITVEELANANPDLVTVTRDIKKDDILLIPYPTGKNLQSQYKKTPTANKENDIPNGTIKIGFMLPLHNEDGDGRRMTEYYRGALMACEDLKARGASLSIYSWNVPIDADIRQTLLDKNAPKCDIIFGPLYTKQVKPLSDFCKKNGIKLVIPFSISGNDIDTNPNLFKVYQTQGQLGLSAINAFIERFHDCHPVFIDCNDTTSQKGVFTFELRKRLEEKGITYNITNLKSSEAYFAKAFSKTRANVVVLNTGRSPQLNVAFAKLDGLTTANPDISVSLFGYTEWLMYTKVYLDYFHKYDTYIPTTFFYNPLSASTSHLLSAYRQWFKSDMRVALPRFALTGYDHIEFFVNGLRRYGKSFCGLQNQNTYSPLQTPLKFVRPKDGGGLQNKSFMLVHYMRNHEIESYNY